MKLIIDNQVAQGIGCHGNLQQILQEIGEKQLGNNRIIWSVKVNGNPYHEQSPHDAMKVAAADIRTLEIGTMDDTEICEAFIQNGGVIADCLCRGTEKVSELFRLEDEGTANKHYGDLLESCRGFFSMLHHTQEVLKMGGTANHYSVEDHLASVNKLFEIMFKAQQNEDWIRLADLLEYELSPLLAECKEIVVDLAA